MLAILFLTGAFLAGTGICRKVFDYISNAEKVLWGLVIGWMLSIWAVYAISYITGDLTFFSIVSVTGLSWITAATLYYKKLPDFSPLKNFKQLVNTHKYLLILLAFFVPFFGCFYYIDLFHPRENGLYLTYTSWYDMCLHLTIASSFAFGKNFPPVYTVLPPEPLRYPFMSDLHPAILMKLGLSIWLSFALTAFIMSITMICIFYYFAKRLINSNITAFIASLLFFFNGGLGFLYFLAAWRKSNESLLYFLRVIPDNYTDTWDFQLKWVNIITKGMIPQRALLYGMPVGFIVLSLFIIAWTKWSEAEAEKRWDGYKYLLPAGILTGLLPHFHIHTYMSLGFISGILFLLKPRFAWLAYWLPAVILAVPQLAGLGNHVSSDSSFMVFKPGWLSYIDHNFFIFMIRNFGLPLLIIFPAFRLASPQLKKFYLPFVALMLFCLIFIVSYNDVDNIKFMYYWYAVSSVIIADWLYKLAKDQKQYFLVVLMIVISTAAGLLSLYEIGLSKRVFSSEEVIMADFINKNSLPNALFLTAQVHNQPVVCLAGRPTLMGYEFWLKSHGYNNFEQRKKDIAVIYSGQPDAISLLKNYNVDYIYLGIDEKTSLKANVDFFENNFAKAYTSNNITIYDAHKLIKKI
jgi:hypothetical protein